MNLENNAQWCNAVIVCVQFLNNIKHDNNFTKTWKKRNLLS